MKNMVWNEKFGVQCQIWKIVKKYKYRLNYMSGRGIKRKVWSGGIGIKNLALKL